MYKLCVISTKNPTDVLIKTINNVEKYYPDFDIVVIDSDSDNFNFFAQVPLHVKVHYIKNHNWELGAWYFAYNTYSTYDVYMFIQDSFTPIASYPLDYENIVNNDYFYSLMWKTRLNRSLIIDSKKIKNAILSRLTNVYESTILDHVYNPSAICTTAVHSSFICNSKLACKVIKLEQVYIDKNIRKSKIDSHLSERIIGIVANEYAKERICVKGYFEKVHLKRDYDLYETSLIKSRY